MVSDPGPLRGHANQPGLSPQRVRADFRGACRNCRRPDGLPGAGGVGAWTPPERKFVPGADAGVDLGHTLLTRTGVGPRGHAHHRRDVDRHVLLRLLGLGAGTDRVLAGARLAAPGLRRRGGARLEPRNRIPGRRGPRPPLGRRARRVGVDGDRSDGPVAGPQNPGKAPLVLRPLDGSPQSRDAQGARAATLPYAAHFLSDLL